MIRLPATAVTRRGLIQGAGALGAAALILPAGARRASAQPTRGGTLRIAVGHGNTSDSFDPAILENLYSQTLSVARSNMLTEIDADGQLIPEIATSWESDDATTWVFAIREGVTYHSGKDLTPDDVVASINYHRGEGSTSAAKPLVEQISDVRADGQNVIFTLTAANADFPFIMSDYHLPILPSTDGTIDPLSPDGSGAYVSQSFEPGVQAIFTRNPNYWKEGRAHADQVELVVILDAAARLNALMTGAVDAIDQVDPATVPMLESRGGNRVLSIAGTAHYVFPMDARVAPFDDNNVRLALKYAIDRQELVDKILNGHGSVGNDHPISPANRFFDESLEQKTYDPDKARFHLKEAGLDSLDVTLTVANAAFSGAVDSAVLWSERAAAAGINIIVDRAPDDGYWDNVWMKQPFCASYWGGRPTEDQAFTIAYASGAPWNESFWEHERFNQLLVEARSELDEGKRAEMYSEMQRILSDEGATVIPMYNNYVMGLSQKVGTPEKVAANWGLDGQRAPERWWIE